MPRGKGGRKKKDTAAQPQTTVETGQKPSDIKPGMLPYYLSDEQREVVHKALVHYAEAVEKNLKGASKIGVPTSEHRRLIRFLAGNDIERGVVMIFGPPHVTTQGDVFYDEVVPTDTEVRAALRQAEVEVDVRKLSTLSPEQKREAIEWSKKYMEAKLNNADIVPDMPKFVAECLKGKDEVDELTDWIPAEIRDDVLNALSQVLGEPTLPEGDVSDGDLEGVIAFTFEELVTKAKGQYLNYTTISGNRAIIFIRGGSQPAFDYGVEPETHQKDGDAMVSLTGAKLVLLARRLLALDAPVDAPKEETPAPAEIPVPEGQPATAEEVHAVESGDGFEVVETVPAPSPEIAAQAAELRKQA